MKSTRSLFVSLVFLAAAFAASAGELKSIRVIAYNICVGKGCSDANAGVRESVSWPSLALELELYEPDIINFSDLPMRASSRTSPGGLA